MRAEHAVDTGQPAATALLDLTKAHEHAGHAQVVGQARAHGFDSWAVRYILWLYRMPRTVSPRHKWLNYGIGGL